eukprot:TRINITY_DN3138_c2_g2_i1.p1 TRINITY_DN3138_c2_g2~~TRINITY_DN3138_c2_g2_i1.p1  ORF type:complete len:282 (+),score=60.40 TRINITY_DN3138_c2_g2_i1:35-847(+)
MVTAKDVVQDSLAFCVGKWFNPTNQFSHPFLNLEVTVVPDSEKPIPHLWVDDVELDGFGAEVADVIGELPILAWSLEERKKRLKMALTRLGLAEETNQTARVTNMSRSELSNEKKRVKQELKKYDTDWRKQFKLLPTHSQKEIMRPLYVYYRKVKHAIAEKERGGDGSGAPQPPDSDDEDRGASRETSVGLVADTAESRVAALEARLNILQQEKGEVRLKLREFQERFMIDNFRKIKFHKDILPVEREYRMYKTVKDEIQKVESQLKGLR